MVGGDQCEALVEGHDCMPVKQAGGTRQYTSQIRTDSKEEKLGGGTIKNRNKATSLSGMSAIK